MRPFAPPIRVGLDSELLRARGLIGETDQVVSIEPSDTGLLVETDSKTMQLTMSDLDAAGNSWVTKRGTQDDPYLMGGAAPWGGEPVWTELPTPLCGPFEPVGTQRGHYIINDCEEQTAFAVTEEVWQRTNMPPEA